MQTDPNWSNFLYNKSTGKVSSTMPCNSHKIITYSLPFGNQIELIDFGATRSYSSTFVDKYFALLNSAIENDDKACLALSQELGYLTGAENEVRCSTITLAFSC